MVFTELLIVFPLAIFCLILPWYLTLINILNLCLKQKLKEDFYDKLTFIFGIGFSGLLFSYMDTYDYNEPVVLGGFSIQCHTPIASWSMPTIISILVLGVVSFFLIRIKKFELPPLMIIGSMSGIFICSIFMILFIVQITNKSILSELYLIYMFLFPINYVLCSIRAIIDVMKRYKEKNIKAPSYNNRFLNFCNDFLYDIDSWPMLATIFAFPLAIILMSILVLFGQRPDEAIKAFLETSDWNLSQKISPPPIEYDGHYLCTVSLKGHKKLVKPTRMGIRRGEKIVVNRQLCIANAFEDLIQDKTPRFHKFIRYIYDKYGFPLAKCIKNAWLADLTYIIMKPLEWIFLIVLYLFDKNPEDRIAVQYTGKKYAYIKNNS